MIPMFALMSLALSPGERAWLDRHALPLQGVRAGEGFADLAALGAHLDGARVVALGECTHGSREVFQLKHRIIEYLAAEHDFTVFGIEASLPDTLPAGAYVSGAELDPAAVVKGMGFWTWSTAEVRDLAVWMRVWNGSHEPDLAWWGFDMQSPGSGARELVKRLGEDPELGPRARALYGAMGGDFAAMSVVAPGEQAAGRSLVLRGRIRVEEVSGWAGLWARADGANGEVLAFDNMAQAGPRGTSDWQAVELRYAVPAETTMLVFGALLSGSGQAWFDDLELSLDGETWTPPEGVDLSFEAAIPPVVGASREAVRNTSRAWRAGGDGYRYQQDGGALQITSAADPVVALAEAEALAAILGALPERWLEARLAITVAQGLKMRAAHASNPWAGSRARDRAMADNVLALLEHTDAKLVLWAHNGHIGRQEGWMGSFLAEALGPAYVPLGFVCGEGEYTAVDRETHMLGTHPLTVPAWGSVERKLTGRGPLLLDLRETAEAPQARWLNQPLLHRSIGAVAEPRQFERAVLPERYDLLVWLPQTTASELLASPPRAP